MENETEKKYITIKMPRAMIRSIEQYIRENPDRGYTSASDFFRERGRDFLNKKK